MSDIVKRLRFGYLLTPTGNANANKDALEAANEIDQLRQVMQNVIDGNYPMKRGKIHRADGTLSKYDTCVHGAYVYGGCENCISDYLEAALEKDASK